MTSQLESFHLREASSHDIPALAQLHVRTFDQSHGGGPTVALRERQWQEIFAQTGQSWFCLVVEDAGQQLVGFAKGQPYTEPDPPGFAGELNKIYVLRECQGLGLGRLLLCGVARRFVQDGIPSMLLFGDARNPSNGFYERYGAERLHAPNGDFHGAYGWRDLNLLVSLCRE